MPADTDRFIVATFALWAGDFAFFEQLLREFSSPRSAPSLEDDLESPEDLIRATGALRLRQFRQKRGEFKRLAAEYLGQGFEIAERSLVLETKHLRGTIWRIGEREFSLQAYLKDLTWEEELFALARREAARNALPQRISQAETESPSLSPAEHSVQGSGATWTVIGNPFMQVELTDLGLVEVSVLWTESRLPESVEEIQHPLSQLLARLDEGTAH